MQSRRATHAAAIALLTLWAASCIGWGDCSTRWESEGYRLRECDDPGEVFLVHEDNGVSLIRATVFAVGADSRYIVVKQHPASGVFESFRFDRSVTNYYIVERMAGEHIDRSAGVQGPLSESEFMALREKLSLPDFSKTFRDLE